MINYFSQLAKRFKCPKKATMFFVFYLHSNKHILSFNLGGGRHRYRKFCTSYPLSIHVIVKYYFINRPLHQLGHPISIN